MKWSKLGKPSDLIEIFIVIHESLFFVEFWTNLLTSVEVYDFCLIALNPLSLTSWCKCHITLKKQFSCDSAYAQQIELGPYLLSSST